MRLDLVTPIEVEITLSRRNLGTLLAFLDDRRNGEEPLLAFRDPTKDVLLVVNAEEDQSHYAKRSNPPGRMPAHIEARLPQRARISELASLEAEEKPCA
jgi:hypothetical protein